MTKITINILFDDDDTNDFECELLRKINTSDYVENIKSFVISRTEATKDEIKGLSPQRIINAFKIYVLANTNKKVTFDDIHTDDNGITHGTYNDISYLNFGRITNDEAVKSIFEKLK